MTDRELLELAATMKQPVVPMYKCLYCGAPLPKGRFKFCNRYCNNRYNIIKGKNNVAT